MYCFLQQQQQQQQWLLFIVLSPAWYCPLLTPQSHGPFCDCDCRSAFHCNMQHCFERQPLVRCSCCCVPVALGGKDAMVVMILIEDVLTLLMMLKDCCRSQSAFRCCVVVCVSRLPLPPLSDRVSAVVVCCGVLVALGGKDLLAMLLVEDASTLLMILKDCCRSRSAFRCFVVVCVSRLPLPPLSDRVSVVFIAAAVVF